MGIRIKNKNVDLDGVGIRIKNKNVDLEGVGIRIKNKNIDLKGVGIRIKTLFYIFNKAVCSSPLYFSSFFLNLWGKSFEKLFWGSKPNFWGQNLIFV